MVIRIFKVTAYSRHLPAADQKAHKGYH